MHGQQGTTSTRRARAPIVISKSQDGQQISQSVNKTKYALCFLCLFDGLRTPSIRRLVRKARTICQKPLVTFDPSCFAPSSMIALQDVYKETLNCPCEITVDPSIQTVLQQIRRLGTSMPPQRLLVHYYGQGSHIPDDGTLYFFSEDHSRYKPLKIATLLNNCSCPLSMIFECSKSAILKKHLESHPDLFAFFSCDIDEFLPLSTDAEMDLFSSCLLSPFQIAYKWHMRRHNKIYNEPLQPTEYTLEFLKSFFRAVLSAIFYDSQRYEVFELFSKDPSVAALARGFVLAQRVMLSYNIHPVALPELESMEDHPMWSFWDIALDCGIAMEPAEAATMVFRLFTESFRKCPNRSFYPLFAFFFTLPSFRAQAAEMLLRFLDSEPSGNVSKVNNSKNYPISNSNDNNSNKVNNSNNNNSSVNNVSNNNCNNKDNSYVNNNIDISQNNENMNVNMSRAESASLSSLPVDISDLNHPPPLALVSLAKMIVTGLVPPLLDQNSSIAFTSSKDSSVLKAGLLCLCCTAAMSMNSASSTSSASTASTSSTSASFSKLAQICIDNAAECAPFSSLLLGSLIEKAGGRIMNLSPTFGAKFAPLLLTDKQQVHKEEPEKEVKERKEEKEEMRADVRAAAAYILGFSRCESSFVIQLAASLDNDKSSIVRFQSALSIIALLKTKEENELATNYHNNYTTATTTTNNNNNNTNNEEETENYIRKVEKFIQNEEENVKIEDRKVVEKLIAELRLLLSARSNPAQSAAMAMAIHGAKEMTSYTSHTKLFELLLNAVRTNNFWEKYATDIFKEL